MMLMMKMMMMMVKEWGDVVDSLLSNEEGKAASPEGSLDCEMYLRVCGCVYACMCVCFL